MGCGDGEYKGRKYIRSYLICSHCGSPMVLKEVNMHPATQIDDKTIKSVFQCMDIHICGRHVYNKERSPIIPIKI